MQLEGDRKVCHYDIQNGCTLHLSLRLKGGMQNQAHDLNMFAGRCFVGALPCLIETAKTLTSTPLINNGTYTCVNAGDICIVLTFVSCLGHHAIHSHRIVHNASIRISGIIVAMLLNLLLNLPLYSWRLWSSVRTHFAAWHVITFLGGEVSSSLPRAVRMPLGMNKGELILQIGMSGELRR